MSVAAGDEAPPHEAFATPEALGAWFEANGASATELWVRRFRKASGVASVTWEECVVEALRVGWIDGQRRGLDAVSSLQRFTPRGKRSGWSAKNKAHAERLIREGKMTAAGLRQVEAARADGRWARAYAGSADLVIPQDFLDALEGDAAAKATFGALNRANLYAIYYRLQTAKRADTRERRLRVILARLSKGETVV